jgi:hypothetical protein
VLRKRARFVSASAISAEIVTAAPSRLSRSTPPAWAGVCRERSGHKSAGLVDIPKSAFRSTLGDAVATGGGAVAELSSSTRVRRLAALTRLAIRAPARVYAAGLPVFGSHA